MGDFEDRLRRGLADIGDRYAPDPDLMQRITTRTRRRARQRRVSAASAFVVASLAVLGTAAALGFTSRYPQHERVNGATAGITSPDDDSRSGSSSGERHAKRSNTAPTAKGARNGSGGDGSGTAAPGSGAASGSHARSSTSTPSGSGTTDTTALPASPALPERIPTPMTDTLPPSTDTIPPTTTLPPPSAPPTVSITGPACAPVGTATFTAVVSGSATVTWSNGQTGPSAAYTFSAPGMVTISASATDGAGRSSAASYAVAVGATC